MRFSNAELPPNWGATLRFLPAGVLLLAAMPLLRIAMPRGAALRGAAIYGVFNFGASYALAYYGLVDAPAGTASVIFATVPLFTLALVALHGQETFHARGLVGALIALSGIALVFREQLSPDIPLPALLAILASAAVAAESGVLAKGLPRMHPIATNAVGMLVGGALLVALSLVAGEQQRLPHAPETWAALLYLSLIGSIGLFALFLAMLRRWTASASSYSIVVMPLAAIALGAALREEVITGVFLAGAALVAVGVYIGALSGAARRGSRDGGRPTPVRDR